MTRDIQAEGRERGHDRHETIERRCGAEDHTRANGETDAHASRGGRDDLRGPRGDTELVGEATALGDGEDAVWARRRAGAMEDDIDMGKLAASLVARGRHRGAHFSL